MSQLIPQTAYKKMPWKNKKGTTSEILIEPPKSSVEKMDFLYRLSTAPIVENCIFSLYPGYERILLPIRGEGFTLNGNAYEAFETAHFSGEEIIECKLLKREITDLGLIFNPKFISAQARTLHLNGAFSFSGSTAVEHLVYVAQGQLTLNTVASKAGDTFFVEQGRDLNFECKGRTSLVLFKITRL